MSIPQHEPNITRLYSLPSESAFPDFFFELPRPIVNETAKYQVAYEKRGVIPTAAVNARQLSVFVLLSCSEMQISIMFEIAKQTHQFIVTVVPQPGKIANSLKIGIWYRQPFFFCRSVLCMFRSIYHALIRRWKLSETTFWRFLSCLHLCCLQVVLLQAFLQHNKHD